MKMSSVDVDTLFQNHTIEEIILVEKQLREDVEKRKEEQRILVGERYRDLINAADAIKGMKDSTSEIFAGISAIGDLCNDFSSQESFFSQTTSQSKDEHAFYSLATQMNLLVDTPEKIWCALDNHEYLLSCRYYLFSQHIVTTSLNMNNQENKRERDLYNSFPILHHQWAAISHFKPSILKGSINSLKDCLIPDKVIAENLCVLTLLDNYSPRQVLTEFLLARKAALQDIFSGSLHSKSVKKQICDMVYLIQLTIQQIVSLFYADEQFRDASPLYYESLNEVVSEDSSRKRSVFEELFGEDLDVFSVARYLPQTVSGFIPKSKIVAVSMTTSYMQTHVSEWIIGCLSDSDKGVKSLLSYVDNIRGLAIIRDAVYDLLSENTEDNTIFDSEEFTSRRTWEFDCGVTLNRKLNIWDEFLAKHFLDKAVAISNQHIETSFSTLVRMLDNTLVSMDDDSDSSLWDKDVTSYIWHEFPQVYQMDAHQSFDEQNTLSLKTNLCTPHIKRLCKDFNDLLQRGLSDIEFFLGEANEQTKMMNDHQKKLQSFQQDMRKLFHDQEVHEAFDKFSNAPMLKELLVNKLLSQVEEFCSQVDNLFKQFDEDRSSNYLVLCKACFLSRLCTNIPKLCHSIDKITKLTLKDKKARLMLEEKKAAHRTSSSLKESSLSTINTSFMKMSERGFQMWCSAIVDVCQSSLKKLFENDTKLLLLSLTNNESIYIEEENETGKSVDSTISLPSQISMYLSSLLYFISEELFKFGLQLADRSMVSCMLADITMLIYQHHVERLNVKENLYQNRILQMLFDVKFLYKFNTSNLDLAKNLKDKVEKQAVELIRQLEEFIDPFDLDVFTPHLDNFIKRQLLRCMLLYGSLCRMDKHTIHISKSLTSYDEQHSAVPLLNNPPRFMLLPLSTSDEDSVRVDFNDTESKTWLLDTFNAHINIH